MKARFSSMVPNASSVAARRMYGDFGAPLPLVVVVVVSDIDSPSNILLWFAGRFPVLVGLAGVAEAVPSVARPAKGALSAAVPSRRWLTMVRRRVAQQGGDWMEVECTRRLQAAPEGSSASPCPWLVAEAVGIHDEAVERTGILRSLDGSKHPSQSG